MEILITGGGGLLGRHLIPPLLERGDRVRVLALPDEDVSWLQERGVAIHRGDVRRRETLAAPTRGAEAVLNLAAMMNAWRPLEDYRAVNVAGTENVCREALAQGVRRIVHVSSWTVYGMGLTAPAREDDPLAPFPEPYGITKAEGDLLVQRMIAEDGLPAAIVRPGTFFGPGDRLHFERMADRLAAGRGIIVGRGDNALPFLDVSDVVRGLMLALDRDEAVGRAFNIAHDQPLTQAELLQEIAHAIGARPPRVRVPYRVLYAAGHLAEHAAALSRRRPLLTRLGVRLFGTDNRHAIERARRDLGYAPRMPLREGVRVAASWYLAERGRA